MAWGTVLIAFVPGYATIGICRAFAGRAGRLLQGFSAGVELGGVSVYLSEMATPGHKGFYVSWQSASQQVAIIVAALIGFSRQQADGARGSGELGLAHSLRDRLPDRAAPLRTAEFARRRPRSSRRASTARTSARSSRRWRRDWAVVLAGVGMVVMTTVSFYLITVYTPTRSARTSCSSPRATVLLVTIVRRRLELHLAADFRRAVGPHRATSRSSLRRRCWRSPRSIPRCVLLARDPTFGNMVAVELWLSLLYAWYNGAMVVALTEVVPANVRTSGFSLAYSLATTLGGSSLAISTWLIHVTGDKASPGYWMSFAALCGLAARVCISTRASRAGRAPWRALGAALTIVREKMARTAPRGRRLGCVLRAPCST